MRVAALPTLSTPARFDVGHDPERQFYRGLNPCGIAHIPAQGIFCPLAQRGGIDQLVPRERRDVILVLSRETPDFADGQVERGQEADFENT